MQVDFAGGEERLCSPVSPLPCSCCWPGSQAALSWKHVLLSGGYCEKPANILSAQRHPQGCVHPDTGLHCKRLNHPGPCLHLFLAADGERLWVSYNLKKQLGSQSFSLDCQSYLNRKTLGTLCLGWNKNVKFLWDEKNLQQMLFLFLSSVFHCQWEATFLK